MSAVYTLFIHSANKPKKHFTFSLGPFLFSSYIHIVHVETRGQNLDKTANLTLILMSLLGIALTLHWQASVSLGCSAYLNFIYICNSQAVLSLALLHTFAITSNVNIESPFVCVGVCRWVEKIRAVMYGYLLIFEQYVGGGSA